ncbi:hypothetical protein [Romboutsia sp.]|uniref:hypothetical protein n=1 Tax=Romboutsia sp. TaxID=1965302 RepID=UPI003F29FF11
MDRLFSFLLLVAMGICIFSFNLFWTSNQLIFVFLSVIGIGLSLVMLLWGNRNFLNKFIGSKVKK